MAKREWTCQKCDKTIVKGQGVVEIINANPKLGAVGEYPIKATEYERSEDDQDYLESLQDRLKQKPNIDYLAYHTEVCDMNPDQQGYWIDVERAESLEQWCAWVMHLCEKTWMSKNDVEQMLSFWFENRNLTPHRLT